MSARLLEMARECIAGHEEDVAEAHKTVAHYQRELDHAKEHLAEMEAELAQAKATYEAIEKMGSKPPTKSEDA